MNPISRNKKRHARVEINGSFCKGCNICIEFCPTGVFEKSGTLNRKGYYLPVVARVEECTGCRLCDLLCPEFAIVITDEEEDEEAGAEGNHDD